MQVMTPELRRWIAEQARAGRDAGTLRQSLQASGWDDDIAAQALQEVWHLHEDESGTADDAAALPLVPGPNLRRSPLDVDAGDRRVAVVATLDVPSIVLFGDLLSSEECEALIAAARPRLSRSTTVAAETGGELVSDERTSQGMFFERGESELVRRIESRIARLVNWPLDYGEDLQVLRYATGAEYRAHYDYFDPDDPGTAAILEHGGQRVGTLVMYLNEPEGGGGTAFPDAGFEVAPRRGHAVFFSYAKPHPSSGSLHAGMPVHAGEKWIATKWLRERRFD